MRNFALYCSGCSLRDAVKTVFFFDKISLTLIVRRNSNSDLQPATFKLHPLVIKGVRVVLQSSQKKTVKQQAGTKTQWNTSQVILICSLHWRKSKI